MRTGIAVRFAGQITAIIGVVRAHTVLTVFSGTYIPIVTGRTIGYGSIGTSAKRAAAIAGACVIVIAGILVHAYSPGRAEVDGAGISIRTINRVVRTNPGIANVVGAFIAIVTVFIHRTFRSSNLTEFSRKSGETNTAA